MQNNVDAVIAALRVALEEAEEATDINWPVKSANRWINQLPGAWFGRWRHLKLSSEYWDGWVGTVSRKRFVGHVRATLAYLETNKEEFERTGVWYWPFPAPSARNKQEPIDADFRELEGNERDRPIRLIKQ